MELHKNSCWPRQNESGGRSQHLAVREQRDSAFLALRLTRVMLMAMHEVMNLGKSGQEVNPAEQRKSQGSAPTFA